MSLDSAEWYLEAAVNFSVAEVWRECEQRDTDTLSITLDLTDGQVSDASASNALQLLNEHLATVIIPEENHLILCDVQIGEAIGNEAVAKVVLAIGSGYDKVGGIVTAYGSNAYYNFGDITFLTGTNLNCGCGPKAGGAGKCADRQIEARINSAIGLPTYGCYYTGVLNLGVDCFWANNNAYTHTSFPTGIPATPYMIYHCYSANSVCPYCFTPSLLTYYTQSTWDLMHLIKPTGKALITASVRGTFVPLGTNAEYFHGALFSYGTLNCTRQ